MFEVIKKIIFCIKTDRIGPDIPFTHWMLHYKSAMNKLCMKKFKYFGKNSEFRAGAYAIYCSHIHIGDNVVIRPHSMLFADEYANIIIEDNVMMGAGVHFYVNNHKYDDINCPIIEQGYYPSKDILVKEGSWIGANAILLPGVVIGKNSVVGAGSIVTKSVPDFCLVTGNPARVIKELQK
jgi:acetyltransferase-like isoleucine patch superfamily enzyme